MSFSESLTKMPSGMSLNSNVPEDESYQDFAKIYRKYKALNRKKIGDYFFKETEDLVDKLYDDFEATVRNAAQQSI